MLRRRIPLLLLLLLPLAAAGCAGDVTAGGMKEVEVYAASQGGPGASASGAPNAAAPALELPLAAAAPSQAALTPTGTLTVVATVELIDPQGGAVPVTTGTTTQLRVERADSVLVERRRVPPVVYPTARITFTQVRADIEGGLVIGGVPRPGLIQVQIPPGGIVVEVPVDLSVPQRRDRLVLDLNALEWLVQADVTTGLVGAAAFRAAVRVRVR